MFSLGGKLFKQVDVNGDGSMEWEEFTGFCIETGLAVGGANSTLRVRSNVQRYTLHRRSIFQTLFHQYSAYLQVPVSSPPPAAHTCTCLPIASPCLSWAIVPPGDTMCGVAHTMVWAVGYP